MVYELTPLPSGLALLSLFEGIGKMDRFDKEMELIENDSGMTQAEKDEAIREIERDYGEAVAEEQRQDEHDAIDRKHGY